MNVIAADGAYVKVALCRSTLDSGVRVRLSVAGSSMLPALWPGDMVDVRRWTPADLAVGAIVVFERERRLVVHRIAAIPERTPAPRIVTRGDALRRDDPPLELRDVLGVVEAVRRRGTHHVPRRRPHAAARGMSYVVGRSEWARRLSLRLYFLDRELGAAVPGLADGV